MLSDYDIEDVLSYVRASMLGESYRLNVLFQLSDTFRVGEGRMHVYSDSSKLDGFLMQSVGSDGLSSNGLTIWSHDDANAVTPDYVVSIGISDFSDSRNRLSLNRDVALTAMFVSVEHELRHVVQYNMARGFCDSSVCDVPSSNVLCSMIATRNNKEFRRDNYNYLPHEIDAERFGILNTYVVISEFDLSSKVSSVMQSTMNHFSRLKSGPVSYKMSIKPFDETLFISSMDSKMHEACIIPRRLRNSFDFAVSYFDKNPDDAEIFKSLRYGYEQDAYLAMISLKYHPEDSKFFDIDAITYPENIPIPNGISPMRGVNVTSDLLPELACDDIIMNTDDIEFDNFDL